MAESRLDIKFRPKKGLLDEWRKEYRDQWQAYAQKLVDRWTRRDKPTRAEIKCAIIGIRSIITSPVQDKQSRDITKMHNKLKNML